MRNRFEPALKLVCLVLGVLVVYQALRLVAQKDSVTDLDLSLTPIQESRTVLSTSEVTTGLSTARPTNATSALASTNASASATGVVATTRSSARMSPGRPAQPDLPPAIQARIDRIVQSEILGPVVRPLPMALLGIAGKDAFIRAPNGQTGLMREGDELGGLKLLRIGTNRVLIEHEQKQSELSIFSGFGSEPLIGKEKPQ